jgi:hypothetical protein
MTTPAGPIKFALGVFEALKLSPLYKWLYETADQDNFLSIEKIKRHLGWQPKHSNAESLIRAYQWYLEHSNELIEGNGISQRSPWKQGILGLFKKCL